MRRIDCFLVCLPLLWLLGCAKSHIALEAPDYPVQRGRSAIVVVAVPREPEGAALAGEAGRLVSAELATRWYNVLDPAQLRQVSPAVGPLLDRLARQALAGEPPDPVDSEELLQRYGVGQLLAVDLYRYEQYWGRETKITRVGVEARLILIGGGRILWRGRADPECSGAPGSGFDSATRRAVRELVQVMNHELPRFQDTPFADWPVLEYFTPN